MKYIKTFEDNAADQSWFSGYQYASKRNNTILYQVIDDKVLVIKKVMMVGLELYSTTLEVVKNYIDDRRGRRLNPDEIKKFEDDYQKAKPLTKINHKDVS